MNALLFVNCFNYTFALYRSMRCVTVPNSFAADFLAPSAGFLGVKIWKQAIRLTFVNTATIIANGTDGVLSTLVANGTLTVSTIVANGSEPIRWWRRRRRRRRGWRRRWWWWWWWWQRERVQSVKVKKRQLRDSNKDEFMHSIYVPEISRRIGLFFCRR